MAQPLRLDEDSTIADFRSVAAVRLVNLSGFSVKVTVKALGSLRVGRGRSVESVSDSMQSTAARLTAQVESLAFQLMFSPPCSSFTAACRFGLRRNADVQGQRQRRGPPGDGLLQQDGATPHTANIVQRAFDNIEEVTLTGKNDWRPLQSRPQPDGFLRLVLARERGWCWLIS